MTTKQRRCQVEIVRSSRVLALKPTSSPDLFLHDICKVLHVEGIEAAIEAAVEEKTVS
jgi:hypothetical protein